MSWYSQTEMHTSERRQAMFDCANRAGITWHCMIFSPAFSKLPNSMSQTGWWFGTFFAFPYLENSHPNWLSYIFPAWVFSSTTSKIPPSKLRQTFRSMSWAPPQPAPSHFRCQQLTWRLGWDLASLAPQKITRLNTRYYCTRSYFSPGVIFQNPDFKDFFRIFVSVLETPWVFPLGMGVLPMDSQVLAARASAVQAGNGFIRPGCLRWKTPWLVGSSEHWLFFHLLGIIISTDSYFSEG